MTSSERDKRAPRYGILLTVSYDGTDFHGYQRQRSGLRTVQGVLEDALSDFDETASPLRAASRTDAGVHALGQKIAFTTERALPPIAYLKELERRLPRDVSVRAAESCADNYTPRFDASFKIYQYRVRVGQTRDPLRDRFHYLIHGGFYRPGVRPEVSDIGRALNLDAIAEGASYFLGRHDFRAFRDSTDQRETTEREMIRAEVMRDPDHEDALRITIEGDAFMKQMVRIMVGTLLEIGRERQEPSWIRGLLSPSADRTQSGPTAPPEGLVLVGMKLGRQIEKASKKTSEEKLERQAES